jgi:hypothetical protein
MIHFIIIGITHIILGMVLIGICPITVGIIGRFTIIHGTTTIIGIGNHIIPIINIQTIPQIDVQHIMDQERLLSRTGLLYNLVALI